MSRRAPRAGHPGSQPSHSLPLPRAPIPVAVALAVLAVLATVAPEPAAAQTVTTFISNTGQTANRPVSSVRATAFTTGTGTYTLSSVGIFIPSAVVGTPAVKIYGDTGGFPGTLLATMTNPGTFEIPAVNSFTAPANTTLSASTTYWVVTSNSAATNGQGFWVALNRNRTLDSGAAAGWSIGMSRSKADIAATSWRPSSSHTRFEIRGTNRPTVATAIPDQSATAGTAFSYVFPANTFSDADTGDTLSYTATKTDDTALPTWLAFTASTRTFSGTPQAADAGTVAVKVTASDGNGGSVSDAFDITVIISVPSNWTLKPTALAAGAKFRLLFLSSTKRDATATDIATYNTFVQTRAAAGHADIRDYSAGFRVVGCTAAVDARDNTATTYTTTDKGVPIYWLNGAKAADQYEDFYDGSWDDEANDKNESGTNGLDTSLNDNWPLTGCSHDGTEQWPLGASQVSVGRPNSSGSDHGPLSSDSLLGASLTRPLYGLSAVFEVAAAVVVPNNPPAFSADTAARSVAENTAAGQNVGAAMTATDADSDTLTYTLEGTDAASFDIVSGSGQIRTRTGVTYNHEAKSTHTVVVKADDGNGGTDTVTVTITVTDVDEPPGRPAAPTVSATAGSTTSLDVTWTAPTNTGPAIASYDLQYRAGTSGNFTNGPQNVTGTSAAIGSLAADTSYEVQVRATNAEGDGDWSFAGTGRTTATSAPGAPTGLTATASGTTQIDLSWSAPASTGGSAITGYKIEVSSNGTSSWTNLVANTNNTTTTYAHTGLTAGATRHYRVSAINANGTGVPSNVANATTGQTTVTFGASSYTAAEGGATAADYSGVPSNVTFTAGQTRRTFTVTATDDADKDGGESVQLGFGTLPAGYAPGARRTATVTLVDDDANLIVNFGTERHTTVKVRESDTVWHRFTFSLSTSRYGPPNGNPQQPVTIPLVVTHRGGATPADYEVRGRRTLTSVTFAVGESVTSFSMRAIPDGRRETGEGLRLDFGRLPAGVRQDDWGPYETIAFVDQVLPGYTVLFGAESYTATEGGAPARVSIHLSEPVEIEPLVVRLVVTHLGATAADYTGIPKSVRFGVGEQTQTITVKATDDTDDDDGESVTLSFVNDPNGRVRVRTGPASATVALADNDGPRRVTVSFGAVTYTATEGGADATVRVELDAAPGRSVTVPLTKAHLGNATAADYSGIPMNVTFAANQTSRTFAVMATAGDGSDGGESVSIGFGTLPEGVFAGSPAATTVTLADGGEQRLVVNFGSSRGHTVQVREGARRLRLNVLLDSSPRRPVTIPLVVTHVGGATEADYAAIPESVTFAAGQTSAHYYVRALPDEEDETGEGLQLDFGPLPPGVRKGTWGPYETIDFLDPAPAANLLSVSGTVVTVGFPWALDGGSTPSPRDFVVSVEAPGGGKAMAPVAAVAVEGSDVFLQLARPVAPDDTVTLSYLADAMHPIRDEAGSPAAPLTDAPGRNQTPASGLLPFSVPARGGFSVTSQDAEPMLRVGYGQVETDAGMTPPVGLAIFGSRLNGILVSEAGVPASAAVLEGRIFAETDGPVRTGLALANPNDTAATIAFFFTNSGGIDSGHGTFTLGPREQIARFLDEEPFNGGSAMFGTFTFTSNQPVAVIALRGFVNERSEFLMTTLPVAPVLRFGAPGPFSWNPTDTVYFPHFADGGGWTTQVVLVNPTYALISGNVQFISSGSETEAAAPATLTLADGRSGSAFTYAIPPRSATRLRTSNPAGPLEVGSVRAVPDPGQPAPSGVSIFAFQKDGMTVSEAGVPASTSGAAFRVYVEASGTPGQPHSVRSGIALTNTSDAPTTVSLELTDLDGTATGLPESLTIPASGHIARFIDEFFPALTTPFSGILRIASTAPDIAAVGLRLAINQRHDILVTTTPPADENAAPTASDLFFPHFVDSGGWTTQFILFSRSPGQTASGVIRFTGQDGQPLELSVAPTAAPTIP